MSGDAENASVWSGADVYIAASGTSGPSDIATAWAVDWDPAGLLDGDDGFTEARSDDQNEFYGWGGVLVKQTKSKHKRTIKFSALEDNDVVFALANPGSTRTVASGVTTSVVKVPDPAEFAIGFEMTDGTTTKRRWVKRASVEKIDDVKDSESGLTIYTFTVALYPESDKTLYHEIKGAA